MGSSDAPRWEPPPGSTPPPDTGWEQPPTPERPGTPLHLGRPDRSPEQRVAKLAERYDVDMVTFEPNQHDVRIARGGWVYYVRAVRWGESLDGVPTTALGPNLLGMATVLAGRLTWRAVRAVVHRAQKRERWWVGVVVGPDPASWNTGTAHRIHKERLEPGEQPAKRVAELAAAVEAGSFDQQT